LSGMNTSPKACWTRQAIPRRMRRRCVGVHNKRASCRPAHVGQVAARQHQHDKLPGTCMSSPPRGSTFRRLAANDGCLGTLGISFATDENMVNSNRSRKNQPPTGQGKHQSRFSGEPRKISKRSDVVQAQRHHPELNLGSSQEEAAADDGERPNPMRPKAGR
jgi:hypothetical protein